MNNYQTVDAQSLARTERFKFAAPELSVSCTPTTLRDTYGCGRRLQHEIMVYGLCRTDHAFHAEH